jgi:hypothetical protein
VEGKQDPGESRGLVNRERNCFNETVKLSWWHVGIIVSIFIASAFLRFSTLSTPRDQIFDEVYFPVFANNYITHTDFYDSHPPLGKLIIATGIRITDNTPFGWRWVNAVTGCLVLVVTAGFTWSLTTSKRAALLALALVAIEPMALVESRVGLINIYLVFFTLLGLWSFWEWWKRGETNGWLLAATAISLSAASAVKWIGIFATVGVFIFWLSSRLVKRTHPKKIKPYHYIFPSLSESTSPHFCQTFHFGDLCQSGMTKPSTISSGGIQAHFTITPGSRQRIRMDRHSGRGLL